MSAQTPTAFGAGWRANFSQRTGYAIGMDNLRLNLPLRLIASGVTAAKDGKRVLSAANSTSPSHRWISSQNHSSVQVGAAGIGNRSGGTFSVSTEERNDHRPAQFEHCKWTSRHQDRRRQPNRNPAINLDAQNINLGGQTGIALRAEIPPLDGIADVAIERRDSEFSVHAMVNAKPTAGLLGLGVPANAQPIVTADAALRHAARARADY